MCKFSLLLIVYLFTLTSYSQVLNTEDSHGEVKGRAPGKPYTGRSDKLEGTVNFTTQVVTFKIPVKSIDTGNKTRNRHMNEALESDKFPDISFEGNLNSTFNSGDTSMQTVLVKGNFTVHGKTNPIEVNVRLKPENNAIKFSASWSINISEYDIKKPGIGFYKVKDQHTITISGLLKN